MKAVLNGTEELIWLERPIGLRSFRTRHPASRAGVTYVIGYVTPQYINISEKGLRQNCRDSPDKTNRYELENFISIINL